MNPIIRNSLAVATIAGLALSLGCARSAEFQQGEKTLRDVVRESTARELRAAERGKEPRQLTREDRNSELGIKPQFQADLDKLGGPKAYDPAKAPLGFDLAGQPVATVLISLEKVVRTAAENNLAVQFARIGPAISQSQITAAEAAFDWTLFSNLQQSWQDSPQPSSSINGSAFGNSINQQNVMTTQVGLRRPLTTGGRFTTRIVHRLRRAHDLRSRSERFRDKGWISAKQIAPQIGCQPSSVHYWRQQGLLQGIRLNDKEEFLYEPPREDRVAQIKQRIRTLIESHP